MLWAGFCWTQQMMLSGSGWNLQVEELTRLQTLQLSVQPVQPTDPWSQFLSSDLVKSQGTVSQSSPAT